MRYLYIIILLVGIFSGFYYKYTKALQYKTKYEQAQANIKAFEYKSKDKAIMFQRTIQELQLSNDSLSKELLQVLKSKRIKMRNVEQLSYQKSKAIKNDTIIFRDTIFRSELALDTIMQDKWYKLNLSLKYPNIVQVSPVFNSERYVIVSSKKETITKPSKIFFIRWFQRKHRVIYVDVEEKNPYIAIDNQRYIQIIK